jgi:ankyrin repeat protein
MAQIVAESDLQDVKQVLKAQPHAILKSISGRLGTPLHIAAVHGRTAVMQLLLQQAEVYSLQQSPSSGRGVPVRSPVVLKMVNSRNDRNQTPLMMAAAQGHGQCVAVLLDMVRHPVAGRRRCTPVASLACLLCDSQQLPG